MQLVENTSTITKYHTDTKEKLKRSRAKNLEKSCKRGTKYCMNVGRVYIFIDVCARHTLDSLKIENTFVPCAHSNSKISVCS